MYAPIIYYVEMFARIQHRTNWLYIVYKRFGNNVILRHGISKDFHFEILKQ